MSKMFRGFPGVPRTLYPLALFVACVLLQSACGGGGGDAPDAMLGATSGAQQGRKKSGGGPSQPPSASDVSCPVLGEKVLPAAPSRAATAPVGTMSGTFAATSMGEATYSVPLAVPPGRAGMEPQLGIVYNSGNGEGTLGMGFAVSRLSAITRCPHTILDDGQVRGVQDTPDDAFCLDGKRLVAVGSGLGSVEYRTFPDTFTQVIAHLGRGALDGQPDSFDVYTRACLKQPEDGVPAGARARSRQDLPGETPLPPAADEHCPDLRASGLLGSMVGRASSSLAFLLERLEHGRGVDHRRHAAPQGDAAEGPAR